MAAASVRHLLAPHHRPPALPGDRLRGSSCGIGPPAESAADASGPLPPATPADLPPPAALLLALPPLLPLPLVPPAGADLAMKSRFSGQSRGTRPAKASKPSGCSRHHVGCFRASRPASPIAPRDLQQGAQCFKQPTGSSNQM